MFSIPALASILLGFLLVKYKYKRYMNTPSTAFQVPGTRDDEQFLSLILIGLSIVRTMPLTIAASCVFFGLARLIK